MCGISAGCDRLLCSILPVVIHNVQFLCCFNSETGFGEKVSLGELGWNVAVENCWSGAAIRINTRANIKRKHAGIVGPFFVVVSDTFRHRVFIGSCWAVLQKQLWNIHASETCRQFRSPSGGGVFRKTSDGPARCFPWFKDYIITRDWNVACSFEDSFVVMAAAEPNITFWSDMTQRTDQIFQQHSLRR